MFWGRILTLVLAILEDVNRARGIARAIPLDLWNLLGTLPSWVPRVKLRSPVFIADVSVLWSICERPSKTYRLEALTGGRSHSFFFAVFLRSVTRCYCLRPLLWFPRRVGQSLEFSIFSTGEPGWEKKNILWGGNIKADRSDSWVKIHLFRINRRQSCAHWTILMTMAPSWKVPAARRGRGRSLFNAPLGRENLKARVASFDRSLHFLLRVQGGTFLGFFRLTRKRSTFDRGSVLDHTTYMSLAPQNCCQTFPGIPRKMTFDFGFSPWNRIWKPPRSKITTVCIEKVSNRCVFGIGFGDEESRTFLKISPPEHHVVEDQCWRDSISSHVEKTLLKWNILDREL